MKFSFPTILLTLAGALLFSACSPPAPPPPPVEEKVSPEEAQMRRQAHALGTKLYAEAEKVEKANLSEEARHQALQPVYTDLEHFVFERMSSYSNRISSITITYSKPALQCVIYIKPGPEAEMSGLKRAADALVGRVVETLPIVKYLMIRNEQ